jgi:cytochrome d ubiquinol oxidase subunit I
MARRSILISSIFGIIASLAVAFTGDKTIKTLIKVQPVKFAAFEAHYVGKPNAGLVAFGILKNSGESIGEKKVKEYVFRIEIPGLLSLMSGADRNYYVTGIKDLINGNPERNIMPVSEKMERGRYARKILTDYKLAKSQNNKEQTEVLRNTFRQKDFIENYFRYFGYAFLKSPEDAIPDVQVSFYAFHFMVLLGFLFIIICTIALVHTIRGTIEKNRWFLWISLLMIPLAYIASESGWILAEMGRQPWIIQDLMPVSAAVSQITAGSVMTTFIMFAILFTALLAAEVSIMIRQIKTGPKH